MVRVQIRAEVSIARSKNRAHLLVRVFASSPVRKDLREWKVSRARIFPIGQLLSKEFCSWWKIPVGCKLRAVV